MLNGLRRDTPRKRRTTGPQQRRLRARDRASDGKNASGQLFCRAERNVGTPLKNLRGRSSREQEKTIKSSVKKLNVGAERSEVPPVKHRYTSK